MEVKHSPEVYIALASKGQSNRAIGNLLNVDEATVRRSLQKAGYSRDRIPEDVVDRLSIEVEDPIYLEGDYCISADWHIPLYYPAYVNKCWM